jgi:peptide/nickel transport system permease protein
MGLQRFLLRRALESAFTIFLAVTLTFIIFRIMPGDPTRAVARDYRLSPEAVVQLRERWGLNLPLWQQYFIYINNLLHGDWGVSFYYKGAPVIEVIFDRRFFNTLVLLGSSIALAALLGFFAGLIAGWRRGRRLDIGLLTFGLTSYSMPVFWLGMLILVYFSYYLGIIPIGGTITPGAVYTTALDYWADYLRHMIGPLSTLTISFFGYHFLVMRNTVIDVFTEDYMLTAYAKGLSRRRYLIRHAARNALLPTVSLLAVESSFLIGGATLTESVFSWYGLGRLIYESVLYADYPVLQGVFLLMSITVVLANFVADLVYAWLDPRIRYT